MPRNRRRQCGRGILPSQFGSPQWAQPISADRANGSANGRLGSRTTAPQRAMSDIALAHVALGFVAVVGSSIDFRFAIRPWPTVTSHINQSGWAKLENLLPADECFVGRRVVFRRTAVSQPHQDGAAWFWARGIQILRRPAPTDESRIASRVVRASGAARESMERRDGYRRCLHRRPQRIHRVSSNVSSFR
jgi:hypothetical protein